MPGMRPQPARPSQANMRRNTSDKNSLRHLYLSLFHDRSSPLEGCGSVASRLIRRSRRLDCAPPYTTRFFLPIAEGHADAERGLLVVVIDQAFAIAGSDLQVEPCGAERIQYRRRPVELREAATGERAQAVAHENGRHVAAGGLIAGDDVAPAQVILDVRVVVVRGAFRDPLPDAREDREPVPFPAALSVHPGPAARAGFGAPVRLMHQAQVQELEAVAFVAGAEGEDGLGLIVRFPEGTRVPHVVRLPAHLLRVAEPQAHTVDAEMTEE